MARTAHEPWINLDENFVIRKFSNRLNKYDTMEKANFTFMPVRHKYCKIDNFLRVFIKFNWNNDMLDFFYVSSCLITLRLGGSSSVLTAIWSP